MKREIGMTNTHQSPTYTFKGKNKKEHMLTHKGSARNKVCGLRVVPNDRTMIRHADGSKEAEKDSLFTGLSLQFGCKGHVMSDVQFGIWYIYIWYVYVTRIDGIFIPWKNNCYMSWYMGFTYLWDLYTIYIPCHIATMVFPERWKM
jgi:hypothetical protein